MALAAHYVKNFMAAKNQTLDGMNKPAEQKVFYTTIKLGGHETDYKVEKQADGSYVVTDIAANKSTTLKASDFKMQYGSLVSFNVNEEKEYIQFMNIREELHYSF